MKVSMTRRQSVSGVTLMRALLLVTLLFSSGCGSSIMTEAKFISQPEQGKALVTFIRPAWVGGAISFGFWDSDNLVGVLVSGQCIQYQTVPGEHYFLARSENWSCVKADLAADRHYVIKANPFMGMWKARVALDPMTKSDYEEGGKLKQVQKWLAKLKPVKPDPQKDLMAYVEQRRKQVLEARDKFEKGGGKYETLAPQDYLPE